MRSRLRLSVECLARKPEENMERSNTTRRHTTSEARSRSVHKGPQHIERSLYCTTVEGAEVIRVASPSPHLADVYHTMSAATHTVPPGAHQTLVSSSSSSSRSGLRRHFRPLRRQAVESIEHLRGETGCSSERIEEQERERRSPRTSPAATFTETSSGKRRGSTAREYLMRAPLWCAHGGRDEKETRGLETAARSHICLLLGSRLVLG